MVGRVGSHVFQHYRELENENGDTLFLASRFDLMLHSLWLRGFLTLPRPPTPCTCDQMRKKQEELKKAAMDKEYQEIRERKEREQVSCLVLFPFGWVLFPLSFSFDW